MNPRLAWLLLGALLTACGPKTPTESAGDAAVADAPLPDADSVIRAYIDAIGGAEALQRHTSSVSRGALQLPGQGISAEIALWWRAPNDMASRVAFPGVGEFLEGVEGGVAWSRDPMSGPRLKAGAELAQALRRSDNNLVLDLPAHFPVRETIGRATLDGQDVIEVRLAPTEGPEEIWIFDPVSGLQVGSRTEQETPMGTLPVSLVFRDYQDFDGILIPTTMEETSGPVRSIIVMTEVTWDPPDFEMPAIPEDVRALMVSNP